MIDYWLKFFGVLVSVAIADVCWTYYFIKVEERKSIAAGLWSAVIMLLGAFSVENYVHDKSFIIAAVIGAFIGTSLSIHFKKNKENANKQVP